MRTLLAFALTMLIVTVPMSVYGDVVTVENLTYSVEMDENGGKYLHVAVPTPQAGAKTIIGYAELRFEAAVDENLELELWEDTGSQGPTWDAESASDVKRARWVMGKDGSSGVRFDLTDLGRSWANEDKTNNGVLIRLRPGQSATDMVLNQEPRMKLVYHVLSANQ